MRSLIWISCGVLTAAPALADNAKATPAQCIRAADDGQKLRDDGDLLGARERFAVCSADGCPKAIAKECASWLEEATAATPSVAFRAKDASGREIVDVQVSLDGKVIATSIDASQRPMNPGKYVIRFERKDGARAEDVVVIRAGEKNRIVELVFKPDAPVVAPPPTSAPRIEKSGDGLVVPWFAWVGLGVAVLGGVGTAAFAVAANDEEKRLRRTCAPACPESERGSVDTMLALANTSLIVGIVGLAGAITSVIVANATKKPATAGLLAPGSLVVRF